MADDEDIGLETLQAQVDMSLAFTQNLVATWLKPTEGKLPSSKARSNEEKELEEYMRRPARLGVGAAVPESTKQLTASAGKKRAREEDVPAATLPSDDEEESRTSVIKKKAKGKKRVPDTPKALNEHPGFQKLNDDKATEATTSGPPETPLREGQDGRDAGPLITPTSMKKKKKKKDRQSVSQLVIERPQTAQPSEQPTALASNLNTAIPEVSRHPRNSYTDNRAQSPAPVSSPPLKRLASPKARQSGSYSTSPSKKKRRRKKKKKKAVAQEEQAPVEEGDSDGSE
ncbi:uncharacterized protein B0H18DRAFT_966793 [Fomitopsis serialis]|uniref:uncharacterized protein n=1 Tax=Fomitopsis serialis TaxID=139415 RepID=UPI0020086639|nr:uncharacterized protein B0H18DRAFT_966793 [Neoantrodia serialis]KAH9938354.1 hypothetical protein B0H18DRAFT_966793 [Neoantrodia serialis]